VPKLASQRQQAPIEHCVEEGGESAGEELMTPSTSAVDGLLVGASRVSVISRAFSIRMTHCAAKVFGKRFPSPENGRNSKRTRDQANQPHRLFGKGTDSSVENRFRRPPALQG